MSSQLPGSFKKRSRRLCLAAVAVSAVKILLRCLHPPHICKACLALLECQPSHLCHSCRSRGCLSVGSLFRENHCSSKGLGRNVLFDFLSLFLSKAVPLSLSLCLLFCAAKKGSSSWEKMQVYINGECWASFWRIRAAEKPKKVLAPTKRNQESQANIIYTHVG